MMNLSSFTKSAFIIWLVGLNFSSVSSQSQSNSYKAVDFLNSSSGIIESTNYNLSGSLDFYGGISSSASYVECTGDFAVMGGCSSSNIPPSPVTPVVVPVVGGIGAGGNFGQPACEGSACLNQETEPPVLTPPELENPPVIVPPTVPPVVEELPNDTLTEVNQGPNNDQIISKPDKTLVVDPKFIIESDISLPVLSKLERALPREFGLVNFTLRSAPPELCDLNFCLLGYENFASLNRYSKTATNEDVLVVLMLLFYSIYLINALYKIKKNPR